MAVRIKQLIIEEFDVKFESIHFWTDSMLNLQYIHNEERRFKVFVANRVAEIRNHSKPNQWHHIEGKQNPADLASRGSSLADLTSSSLWFEGPRFLHEDESKSRSYTFTER